MRNLLILPALASLALALTAAEPAQEPPKTAATLRISPPVPEAQRTQWFRDAKFGIFIHWGAYSVIGRHEWARELFQIPQAEYDVYARRFDPEKFNATEWLDLISSAGARYMVITSKHHDGFSTYRSKVSDYGIKITPYKGDPLKDLAVAAKAHSIRLGFYHSIMDWHNPDYIPKRDWEIPNQPKGGNIDTYIEFMKGQLRELLTGYGDVATVWFDGEWEHSTQEMHSAEVYDMIRGLQPNALINDRLFKREPGNKADYGTPEQYVPATGEVDASGKPILWESCITVNTDSWGYNKYETDWKTRRDLIRMLVEVVSKGGNLLLNIGPSPDGTISEDYASRLRAMGAWLRVNGESIYGTTASPFSRLPFFGRATTKGDTLYLHVFQWPLDGRLAVPGLENRVVSAKLLGQPGARLATERDGDGVLVYVPTLPPDDTASVIALKLEGAPRVKPFVNTSAADGKIVLNSASSEIETTFEQRAKKENFLGHVFITNWTRNEDVPSWNATLAQNGNYRVEVSYGAEGESANTPFTVLVDDAALSGKVAATGSGLVFKPHQVGQLKLKAGPHTIRVKAVTAAGHEAMNLESVTLIPVGS